MYQKGADAGSFVAMWNLGNMYFHGIGIEADVEKAKEWYDKHVEAGGMNPWYEL